MWYSHQPSDVASLLLKSAVLLVLILFRKAQTAQGNYPNLPRWPFVTLLDVSQMVLLTIALALATGCRTLKPAVLADHLDVWTLRSATADFAMAVSLIMMTAVLAKRWVRCLPPSGFVCTLLGCLAAATVLDAFRFWAPGNSFQTSVMPPQLRSKQSMVAGFVLAAVMLGSFLNSGSSDLVLAGPTTRKNLTVKVSHRARFGDSLATSRVMQLVTETMDTLSSLRAYGLLPQFRKHYYRLTDQTISAFNLFVICFRLTRAIASCAAFVVVSSTLVANIAFPGEGGPDPSNLGLILSAACSVPLGVMTRGGMIFGVLQMIVGFERCLEYMELGPEDTALQLDLMTLPKRLVDLVALKIGVVGRTGAGKSCMVLALLRMLDASQEKITIDGVDIFQVPLPKLRRSITVIPQDPSLVRGILRINLDPGNSYSDEKIWWALERGRLATIVLEDPKKLLLETIDGGCNLSVGQRQLVCLARALLRDTRVLLLDEATSQMYGDTDRLIQATLRDAFAQCTFFTIAHRIHTVLDYDRVLVLDDGRVQELDSPDKLLSDPSSMFHALALDAGIRNVADGQRNKKPIYDLAIFILCEQSR